MAGDRPGISAELKRRVLVEAGHRCAIPTCRYIEVEIHHIIPWETCRSHDYENLIALCPNCHNRADAGKIDRKALRLYKFNLRTAHDKFSQLEIDMLLTLFNSGEGAAYPWMPYLEIFFTRAIEAKYLAVMRQSGGGGVFHAGVNVTPTFLVLTDKGREFVAELGLHEM